MGSNFNSNVLKRESDQLKAGTLSRAKHPRMTKKQEAVILRQLHVMRGEIVNSAILVPGTIKVILNGVKRAKAKDVESLFVSTSEAPVGCLVDFLHTLTNQELTNPKDLLSILASFNGFQVGHSLRHDVLHACNKLVDSMLLNKPVVSNLNSCDYALYRALIRYQAVLIKFNNVKEQLFQHNIGLVHHLCSRFARNNSHLEYSDFFQEGCAGLLEAIERFKIGAKNRFFTYAHYWVLLYLDLAVKNKERAVRIPIHATVKINKIKRSRAELMSLSGKDPTDDAIAAATGVGRSEVAFYSSKAAHVTSLNTEDDTGASHQDRLAGDACQSAESILTERYEHKTVVDIIDKCLNKRARDVVMLRSGLLSNDPLPFKAIAAKMGLSMSVVHSDYRMSVKALGGHNKLRSVFNEIKARA